MPVYCEFIFLETKLISCGMWVDVDTFRNLSQVQNRIATNQKTKPRTVIPPRACV